MIPIKAEVGATAKASLEVKGELSTSAADRLANAFADAISPFTERRGLKGDLVRLQREEVAIQIANLAREKIFAAGLDAKPIPNKVLVPLLEKASLEEPESNILEQWSSLLAASSTTFDLQHPIFSDALSRISEREVKFLDKLHKRTRNLEDTRFNLHIAINTGVIEPANAALDAFYKSNSKNANDNHGAYCRDLLALFAKNLMETGCILLSMKCQVFSVSLSEKYFRFVENETDYNICLDVLCSVGLLKRESATVPVPTDAIGEFALHLDICRLTDVGRLLLGAFSTFNSNGPCPAT